MSFRTLEWTGDALLLLDQRVLPGKESVLRYTDAAGVADAIRAIETVLELNGIAVVPLDDKFLKVVQVANARQESPPIITGSTLELPASGRVSTKIFQLSFLQAQPFGQSLTNLPRYRMAGLGLGRTFQNVALFRPLSVRDNLMMGAYTRRDPAGVADDIRILMFQALDDLWYGGLGTHPA